MTALTTQDIIKTLAHYPVEPPLPAPPYEPPADVADRARVALAVPSMEQHTSNEGWQLMLALRAGGYGLFGYGVKSHGDGFAHQNWTDIKAILEQLNPAVVFVQDQHEWSSGHLAKKEEFFRNAPLLATRLDVFKLTVMKDTHRQYESNKRHSQEIGCHAWVTYYSIPITLRTLNWLRPQHVIRTWHTVDPAAVPPFSADRQPCLLSGSLGGAYPLRERIHKANLPGVTFLRHPGYSNKGTSTPEYLKQLSRFKVAICTASRFGYCLRKLIEATACGCKVITDLPVDEIVPEIDGNLFRVSPNIDMDELSLLIRGLSDGYNTEKQQMWAEKAKQRFDWRVEGVRLSQEIENMRATYQCL